MAPKKHARSASADGHDGYIDEAAALKHPPAKKAKEIDQHPPFETLTDLIEKTSSSDVKPRNVLHWFRSKDIRQEDNKGLWTASQKAKEAGVNLLTMYLHSPQDVEWHGTSPARIDFILESLRILQDQLSEKNIPLAILTAEKRAEKVDKVMDFVKENDVSHIFANYEYEADELRRDISIAKRVQDEQDLSLELHHDQTVVVPGTLTTGGGGPHKVFTPYHKAWLSETKSDPSLYDTVALPEGNSKEATKSLSSVFSSKIPEPPSDKQFESVDERDRIRKLWPAGHEAGINRLRYFLEDKVSDYAAHRSEPARDPSSRLSPYFASGVISIRETLQHAQKFNKGAHFDAGDKGIDSWVRELVFREFYRHTLVHTPHTAMNLPHNVKFDFVQWEDDHEGWKKWCEGETGVPFVDAGMRQLRAEKYMHNRLRMNVSSYLSGNLLIDYRKGERFFAETLIDWDLANNTNGWEPSYTIFNPVTQAEKCDKEGAYIRKWVPELKGVKGKAVFAPHERLGKGEFEKLGYPRPHVDYAETAQRAKGRYKQNMAEADI